MSKDLRQKLVYGLSAILALVGVILALVAMLSKSDEIMGVGGDSIWKLSKDFNDGYKEGIDAIKEFGGKTAPFTAIKTAYGFGTIGAVVMMVVCILALGAAGFGTFKAFTGGETPLWMEISTGVLALVGMVIAIVSLVMAGNVTDPIWVAKKLVETGIAQ